MSAPGPESATLCAPPTAIADARVGRIASRTYPWWRSLLLSAMLWALTRIALGGVGALSFAETSAHVPLATMWVQWDANIYLSVVDRGYTPPRAVTGFESGQSNLNFFPFTPLGIAIVHLFVRNLILAGLAFANGCAIAAGAVLHRLGLDRFGRDGADWTLVAFFALPGSFILSAPMSEAPYLLLSAGAALLASRSRFAAASGAAALLTITRLTGILLGIGLALDWLVSRVRGEPRHCRELLFFALVPLPVLGFMLFMWHLTGDALASLHSQETFWNQHAGIPLQNLVLFAWSADPRLCMQGAVGLLMTLVLLGAVRHLTPGERLFAALSILSFTSSYSSSESLIRYMIGLYPLHLAFGRLAAASPSGRGLLAALATVNGALMITWVHGTNVLV